MLLLKYHSAPHNWIQAICIQLLKLLCVVHTCLHVGTYICIHICMEARAMLFRGVSCSATFHLLLGGTGSPTEPESYQVSFFRQASLWALGSTYPCLIGMFHHKRNFTCIWGVWTPILMLVWQALYRLSLIPSFQPENVKMKRKVLVKQKIQYILLDPNALFIYF